MKSNEHSQQVPGDKLQDMLASLTGVYETIKPFAPALTPEDRHNILKMGARQLDFMNKGYELAVQNGHVVPPFMSMEEFAIDRNDAVGLTGLLNVAQQVVRAIEDVQMVAAAEAYNHSLTFYHSVKQAATQNVPGAQAVVEVLKPYFTNVKRKAAATPAAE